MKQTESYSELIEKEIHDSFSIQCWNDHIFDKQKPVRVTYNRIFLIREGRGTLYIDDNSFSVKGPEIFLLGKGQVFSFEKGSALNGFELCFGDCFWEKTPASANNCKAVLYNEVENNQYIPLKTSAFSEMYPLFTALYEEYSAADYPNKPDALAAYLKIIMIKTANLKAALDRAYDDNEKQIFQKFLDLVDQRYQLAHDVSDYAAQLKISTRKLSEVCKRNGEKGPKEVINGKIISEAKRALQFGTRPVKEIAFDLNFTSPEQFSHFFKKHTHISPQFFRSGFVKIGM